MASFLGRVTESIFNQLLKEGIKRVFGHREKKNERKKGSKEKTNSLGYPNGNKYGRLIGGWTKYWNDVLAPKTPLSPDFVKALIATESSFNLPEDVQSKIGPARGLIQITESTCKILQDPNGGTRASHSGLHFNER